MAILRKQVQLYREDASRAATRLNEKEMELARLRKHLERTHLKYSKGKTTTVSSYLKDIVGMKWNDPVVQQNKFVEKPISAGSSARKYSDHRGVMTTFDELDSAMAR